MIVKMKKAVVFMKTSQKTRTLEILRDVGVLHLSSVTPKEGSSLEELKRAKEQTLLAIALLYYTNEENEDLSFSLTTFGFLSSSFAFCVIGLSSTPALHIFGLTTAMGILSSGIITLLIRPQPKN